MNTSSHLSPSLEDYLESIYFLKKSSPAVRIKDIADNLNVKMPSVIGALKVLKEKGYIEYEKTSPLILTEEGFLIAESVLKRHRIIADFLEKAVLLPRAEADTAACKIEHVISPETAARLENLTSYLDYLKKKTSMSKKDWQSVIMGKDTL